MELTLPSFTMNTGVPESFTYDRLSATSCTSWGFCSAFTQHILYTFTGTARAPGSPESIVAADVSCCLVLHLTQAAKRTHRDAVWVCDTTQEHLGSLTKNGLHSSICDQLYGEISQE